jgi:hypothetical protein
MTPSFLFHKKVGVEVETNLRMAESTANFGYQIDLPKANLVFRGNVHYINCKTGFHFVIIFIIYF